MVVLQISIHSLRTEGDLHDRDVDPDGNPFQSTPSARRETAPVYIFGKGNLYFNPLPPHGGRPNKSDGFESSNAISIHSLRTEGDGFTGFFHKLFINFNPLPPHGGRREILFFKFMPIIFQSTPSARRETTYAAKKRASRIISIHSLRTEGD